MTRDQERRAREIVCPILFRHFKVRTHRNRWNLYFSQKLEIVERGFSLAASKAADDLNPLQGPPDLFKGGASAKPCPGGAVERRRVMDEMGYPLAWTAHYILWSDLEPPPTS